MNRAQKEEKIAAMHQMFQDAEMVVITHQNGLTVAESTDLRQKMIAAGASFRVTKNRLAKIALKGTRYENLTDLFNGPTAVALSRDAVAGAKTAVEFAKSNDKLVIIGGGLGDKALDASAVQALAKLPSLDELRASLVAMIQTPATRMAGVLQAPAGQLARVVAAYARKDEAA